MSVFTEAISDGVFHAMCDCGWMSVPSSERSARAWAQHHRATCGDAATVVASPDQDALCTVRRAGDWVLVKLGGDLDVTLSPRLRDMLIDLIDAEARPRIDLDLGEVTFLDSTGIGVLVGTQRRIDERGGELTLSNLSLPTYRVLQLTGLLRVFTIRGPHIDLSRSSSGC